VTEQWPLTRRQRWIVAALTAAIALTRLYALSRSLWDWDEALFSAGVRAYDVTQHHPHPPGFPLFMLAAKLVHLLVRDEFRSVQAVTLLGAIGLFPALFFLARALRWPFAVAAGGAALYAFFPAVWIFGGTGFSDIPSTTLVLIACTLFLRDKVIAGAIVLGIATGFRSQNLLIGCAPALWATWRCFREQGTGDREQVTRPVTRHLFPVPLLTAISLGAIIVLASYAGAAYASADPPRGYLGAMANLRKYVHDVDSVFNPAREPLRALLFDYFVHPIRSGRFDYVVDALAAIGFLANVRRFGAWMALAMFVPFQLFGWLMLDPMSVSRYGTAWLPAYALFAAAGAHVVSVFWIDAAIVAALVARLAWWTLPAVQIVRNTDSPPASAMQEIVREHPAKPVYVHRSMSPFADVDLSGTVDILHEKDLPFGDNLYVCECVRPGRVYQRPLGTLWHVVRRRYFAVTLTTLDRIWRFGDGWHDEEGEGALSFRWMAGRSVTVLPPAGPRARLALTFSIPTPLVAQQPLLTVTLNGRLLDRVRCTAETASKTWDVDADGNAPNELVLSIDRVIKPPGDARELGLRLDAYSWTPRQ
jgi:hypothetical protein